MNAVVYSMRMQGGWPLSVWLTPDKKPFWGGTYFPKPQFLQVLAQIDKTWKDAEGRKKIEKNGASSPPSVIFGRSTCWSPARGTWRCPKS